MPTADRPAALIAIRRSRLAQVQSEMVRAPLGAVHPDLRLGLPRLGGRGDRPAGADRLGVGAALRLGP